MKALKNYSFLIILLVSAALFGIYKLAFSPAPESDASGKLPVSYEASSEAGALPSSNESAEIPAPYDITEPADKAPSSEEKPSVDIPGEEAAATETETKTEPEPETETEPEEEKPPFIMTSVDDSYFDDALFIGDSRTSGLSNYGDFQNAYYFCNPSLSAEGALGAYLFVRTYGNNLLSTLLEKGNFGKIYIMLGINELPGIMENNVKTFGKLIELIREKKPDAIIYIQSNLHVNRARTVSDKTFNNDRINEYNGYLSAYADNEHVFYLDVNTVFDDEEGNLADEYTGDGTHLLAKCYYIWCDFLRENAIVMNDDGE
ncbi:MAG: GDSL-type esterase/lipase family protein [Oscillospiraceae bacterium]|nr:GDSL-type esterase/lipase family protein [Oscillospiraceae bacterium]